MKDKHMAMTSLSAWRLIGRLAIPTVIITLVMAVYNIADIFFIGKTGNADMVNAISVCMPAFTVIQAFGTLIGAGGCTAISIALGRGERNQAKHISAFCFYCSLGLGLLLAIAGVVFFEEIINLLGASDSAKGYAADYLKLLVFSCPILIFSNAFVNILRADGSVKESVAANLAGTFTNIVLDPIFILAMGMGVKGAAVATVIGNAVAAVIVLNAIREKPVFSVRWDDFTMDREISLSTLSLGLPLAAGTMLMSVSYMVLNHLLLLVDSNAQGAFGISRTMMLLSTMIQLGICMGLQPAVSYNYGLRNEQRVRELVLKTGALCLIFGFAVAAVCIGFRSAILNAFIRDEAILSYGRPILLGCFVSAPIYGVYQCSVTFLQATERPLSSAIVTILRQGGLLIPVMILLYRLGGFNALVFCFALTDVIAALTGAVLLHRRLKMVEAESKITNL